MRVTLQAHFSQPIVQFDTLPPSPEPNMLKFLPIILSRIFPYCSFLFLYLAYYSIIMLT